METYLLRRKDKRMPEWFYHWPDNKGIRKVERAARLLLWFLGSPLEVFFSNHFLKMMGIDRKGRGYITSSAYIASIVLNKEQ